jgi:hypothetical protein
MADTRIKKLSWLAALTLAVGGLAACGEEVVTDTASASRGEASRGSDQHLNNQAAEIEARNAAREAAQAAADRYVEGLESRAPSGVNQQAEIADQRANQHLYNQAAEIEARNAAREAAQAAADRYVEGLESRAETVTTTTTPPNYYPHGYDYGGEEEQPAPLPGSHNVPN